jgi:hypothetical protein
MAKPDPRATVRLASIRRGKPSTAIPATAPIMARKGETKVTAPVRAKRKPVKVPSNVFLRLNGS